MHLPGSIFAFLPFQIYKRLSGITNMTDVELARLCANGDESARKELYTRYAAWLYALCIRYVGDRELARDLMHDAMIKIFDCTGKYQPHGSLKSWCSRVTVNLVIDHLRKSRQMDVVPLEESLTTVPQPDTDEVEKIPKEELLRMVSQLPPTKRVVFNLYCVEGYSHKEISALLNIKEKTSSSLLFKARGQLAENIKEYIKRNGL